MAQANGISVNVKTHIDKFVRDEGRQLDEAALEMATDIHRRSSVLAPKDTRALVNSGRINRLGQAEYTVTYGDRRVRYARIRHFENQKNPQTLRYLERAGDSVIRGNTEKYFKR